MNVWNSSLDSLTPYFSHSIRGNHLNDIFICGAYNDVLHFNGSTWKSLRGINNIYNGRFTKLDFRKNLCAIVGSYGIEGIIAIGKR